MATTIEDRPHPQVPFITRSGVCTTVDDGMFDVLLELARLGVETQYSCENNFNRAYVLASGCAVLPIVKRLSPFKKAVRVYELSHFRDVKENLHVTLRSGSPQDETRSLIEVECSRRYGLRTLLRWPTVHTESIVAELRGISRK